MVGLRCESRHSDCRAAPSIQSEEGLSSRGTLLSHVFPCNNRKALSPVTQSMQSALVRRGGGGVVQAVVVRGVRQGGLWLWKCSWAAQLLLSLCSLKLSLENAVFSRGGRHHSTGPLGGAPWSSRPCSVGSS